MQIRKAEQSQTFPRLACYDACEPIPINAVTIRLPVVGQRTSPSEFTGKDTIALTSFDAILDAYAKDPERWDGLE
jgi:hypothetical protein